MGTWDGMRQRQRQRQREGKTRHVPTVKLNSTLDILIKPALLHISVCFTHSQNAVPLEVKVPEASAGEAVSMAGPEGYVYVTPRLKRRPIDKEGLARDAELKDYE